MDKYVDAMTHYADDEVNSWSDDIFRLTNANSSLLEWMRERVKHLVINFFDEPDNRICYVRKLYGCRVTCFLEILKETKINPTIEDIIRNKSSIVSFGCGPAPEVAAYICYVREILNSQYQRLDFLAVDCLPQWGSFIDVVSHLDSNATIRFEAGLLSNQYLLNMPHYDVCIMSYPHAVNFEDIWGNLKKKFTLIIFIDQARYELLAKAREHEFQFVNFNCKGDKTFFYYFDKNYIPGANVVESKCQRGLHNMDLSTSFCTQLIGIMLTCGHSIKICCSEKEEQIRYNKKCVEDVRIDCRRYLHDSLVPCGSSLICQKSFEKPLICGHSVSMRCDENDFNPPLCMSEIWKSCARGSHRKLMRCSSLLVCNETVSLLHTCGHEYTLKCSEKSFNDCMQPITKTCIRGVHKQLMDCSSAFICEETIECHLTCGHKCLMKCCDDISSVICTKMLTKRCSRNIHKYTQECGMPNKCNTKCCLLRQCGCSKLVLCDDYERSHNSVCKDDCKLEAREIYLSRLNKRPVSSGFDHGITPCGNECDEICNLPLECGHNCQWRCFQCLNGRLHRPCLDKCTQTLGCGHVCIDMCHYGDCQTCSDNCFLNRTSNFFRITNSLSSNDQSNWSSLLESRIDNGPIELKDLFEKTVFNMKWSTFSKNTLERYKISYEKMRALLDFNDAVVNDDFPSMLERYRVDIQRSIFAMSRWICPETFNTMKSSLADFNMEFQRIKTIFTLCHVAKLYLQLRKQSTLTNVCELLNQMMATKHNDDEAIIGLYTKLSVITMNEDID